MQRCFGSYLGHGSPSPAHCSLDERPEGTPRLAEWWYTTSPRGATCLGTVATGQGYKRTTNRRLDSSHPVGHPQGGTSLSARRFATGTLREAATGSGGSIRRQPKTAADCHGLQQPAGRPCPLDCAAGGRGSRKTQTGSQGGKGNHSRSLAQPRPEAVAGKKCGWWPTSMKTTSPKWKTCWRCTSGLRSARTSHLSGREASHAARRRSSRLSGETGAGSEER